MTNRTDQIDAFLAKAGWKDAERALLAGDASNRRYDRIQKPDGQRAVLMDAPAEKGEDVRPFQAIAAYLSSLGLSAPQIYAADPEAGFLLIEDLGDAIYARILEDDPSKGADIYTAAMDVLVTLHQAKPPELKHYDAETMTQLAALAFDWYLLGATGQADPEGKSQFCADMKAVLAPLDQETQVVIQRDYHAENLLWLPDREAAARVGLLDFQDAMLGHPAYDLVSLLQDARRDVSPQIEAEMIAYFLSQTDHESGHFSAAYAALGAQRNLRILGVFTRLCIRDGKAHYVDLIPRVWAHLETNLAHPTLAILKEIVAAKLPAPTPEILQRLKRQCAQIQTA